MIRAATAAVAMVFGAATVGVLGVGVGLPAALIFTVVSVVLVVVDVRERRLPHRIVLPAIGVVLVAQAIAAWHEREPSRFAQALAGGLIAGLGLLAVHLVSPQGLGFGDVTYATLIGSTLGVFGLTRVGLGLGLGFMIGAVMAGPAVMLGRRRAARSVATVGSSTIPFGPALALGAWIAMCWGGSITQWYGRSG